MSIIGNYLLTLKCMSCDKDKVAIGKSRQACVISAQREGWHFVKKDVVCRECRRAEQMSRLQEIRETGSTGRLDQ